MTPRGKRILGGTLAIILGLVIIVSLIQIARAETIDGDRITIIDGDTVALPCPGLGLCKQERIRILNIDAPETRGAVCEAENIAGLAAKEALRNLLKGQMVDIIRCEPETGRCEDRYRRTLARLATQSGDVGQALIASGHALPWAPGAAAKFQRQQHWCGKEAGQ